MTKIIVGTAAAALIGYLTVPAWLPFLAGGMFTLAAFPKKGGK